MFRLKGLFKGIIVCLIISAVYIGILSAIILFTGSKISFSNLIETTNLFLYAIGYSDIQSLPLIPKIALSLSGIICLGFINAYITVAFLVRKKLDLYHKIAVWNVGDRFIASLKLRNNGKDIVNLKISMVLYIDRKKILGTKMEDELYIPYLQSGKIWVFDVPINIGSFMYQSLRYMDEYKSKLYVIIEYNDNITGQQFTNTYVYEKNAFIATANAGGFTNRRGRSDNLSVLRLTNSFGRYSLEKERKFDMESVVAISRCTKIICNRIENAIAQRLKVDYVEEIWGDIRVLINWKQRKRNERFSMAWFKLSNEKWDYFIDNNWGIRFIIYEAVNICAFNVQVKQLIDGKRRIVINHIEEIGLDPVLVTIPIRECFRNNHADNVCELCFTIYENQIINREHEAQLGIANLSISK